jgi:RNA polymerase sigma-70 factor (ECF subfamily)
MAVGDQQSERQPPLVRPDARWGDYIRAAADGESHALARLYDESCRLVYAIAFRIVGNAADADEVTVDVYTQVWRQARTYDPGRSSPSTWLIMLARSRALDRVRARDWRRRRETVLDEAAGARSAGDPPDQAAFLGEQRSRVRSAMAALAPDQREAIELAFFDGLTHSELAERLGQPLGTVKTRIRLGLMKLRQALAAGREGIQ